MGLQDALGILEKPLPFPGQPNPVAASMQKAATEDFLQSLHLHGHRGLGSSDLYCGPAERPGMGGVDKGDQKPKVDGRLHINIIYIGLQ
jgi:hypothetical protein